MQIYPPLLFQSASYFQGVLALIVLYCWSKKHWLIMAALSMVGAVGIGTTYLVYKNIPYIPYYIMEIVQDNNARMLLQIYLVLWSLLAVVAIFSYWFPERGSSR